MSARRLRLLARTLLVVSALLCLIAAAGTKWYLGYGCGGFAWGVGDGCFVVTHFDRDVRNGWYAGPRDTDWYTFWQQQLPQRLVVPWMMRINLPIWTLIFLSVSGSYAAFRRSRGLPGHCPECRYDLHATPRSTEATLTCPECGHTQP